MPIVLASATLTSTGIGGLAAFRFRESLHLLLGFSSGAVIAVALFDMLPEVVALGGPSHIQLAAVGFLAFFNWNDTPPCIAPTTILTKRMANYQRTREPYPQVGCVCTACSMASPSELASKPAQNWDC